MFEDEISRIAFADPDMVRYLLALLPADATAGLDTRRLRRLPAEQIGRGARRRVADMAWAVGAPTPERPDAEALLVVEFQATPPPRMALRMDAYVALLRQEMAESCRPPSASRGYCPFWSTPATARGGRPDCGSWPRQRRPDCGAGSRTWRCCRLTRQR